tara:strand:+ start:1095 stop:1529 length:435 start_codon:yes stop_codon:yes gene_type:complete
MAIGMGLTNNELIITQFYDCLSFASEQLMSENNLTIHEKTCITDNMMYMIQKRLDKGAIDYGTQVPILAEECLKVDRDNLKEGIEECIDGLVYTIAERIKAIRSEDELYNIYINRSITNLCYALYNLCLAEIERQDSLNEKKEA